MKRLSNALWGVVSAFGTLLIALGVGVVVLILTIATVGGIVLGLVRRK
jgi:hypothetical protein